MSKKISEKDKKDWKKFINSDDKLENKDDNFFQPQQSIEERTIDLHGFSIENANETISDFIEKCYSLKVNNINIITGKSSKSKNQDNPYQSMNLSILKYSVPHYIKNNLQLMKKIKEIDFNEVNNPSKGSFKIYLKKKL